MLMGLSTEFFHSDFDKGLLVNAYLWKNNSVCFRIYVEEHKQ